MYMYNVCAFAKKEISVKRQGVNWNMLIVSVFSVFKQVEQTLSFNICFCYNLKLTLDKRN